jgi:hypothetical protein
LFWDTGIGGGSDPYLSPLDRPPFRDLFSQGQPNSIASRAGMHSSLVSIWRFSDDELT